MTHTTPTLSLAEMALTEKSWTTEQRQAYTQLLYFKKESELLINQRYRISHFIGRGGFGLVFAARDLHSDRMVALKFIHPQKTTSPPQNRRIIREFEIAQKLQHPGLVRLYALETWDGIHVMVMDLVDGMTLSDLISRQGPMNWPELSPIMNQLIDVLAYVHQQGVIHRDIKPSNIIIGPDGKATLLDLGLTRELDDQQKTASTGELVGSPHYLPPEVIMGHKPQPSSDLYQLALNIHYALAGRHPYEESGSEPTTILGQQLSTTLRFSTRSGMPLTQRLLLNRCLEKKPSRRPHDAAQLKNWFNHSRLQAGFLMNRFLPSPLKSAMAILLLATAAIITHIFLPLAGFSITDQEIRAQNMLGFTKWTKPADEAEQPQLYLPHFEADGTKSVSVLFSPNQKQPSYRVDQIKSDDFPLRWVRYSERGEILHQQNLSHLEDMDYFDFSPLAQLESYHFLETGKPKQTKLAMTLRHIGSMFPSLFVLWDHDKTPLFSLFTPGAIDKAPLLEALARREVHPDTELCVQYISNPFCHYTLWVWNLKAQTPLPPSFSNHAVELTQNRDLVLLPTNSRLLQNRWHQEGWVSFQGSKNKTLIRFQKTGQFEIESNLDYPKAFTENFSPNTVAMADLNEALFYLYRQEDQTAAAVLDRISITDIQNPWLLSLIAYYRAEVLARQGDLEGAQAQLLTALRHDPENGDARNRQIELIMLNKGYTAAMDQFNREAVYYGQFWGLTFGQDLFRFCSALMANRPQEAEAVFQRLQTSQSGMEPSRRIPLTALKALFTGSRDQISEAITAFSEPQSSQTMLFDISEQQLILARLWMIMGEGTKAEPYLRHFTTQTIVHKPFADISLAWCEAEAGRTEAAVEQADRAFSLIRRMAKSQFWARFWLFYDAYAYGRTMEKAGQHERARAGYQLCIELAPQSFLAHESRNHLLNI